MADESCPHLGVDTIVDEATLLLPLCVVLARECCEAPAAPGNTMMSLKAFQLRGLPLALFRSTGFLSLGPPNNLLHSERTRYYMRAARETL